MFKGMEPKKGGGTAKELGLCHRCVGKGHLVFRAESVELTDA